MKSVIMVAHAFPPEGKAGVYRPLRFVRHLPAMGWRPTVVTLDTDSYERYDPELLALVPQEIEIIRVRNRDWWHAIQARRARRIQKKLSRVSVNSERRCDFRPTPVRSFIRQLVRTAEMWAYHPDTAMCWIGPAVESISKVCASKRPDVIWATGGPWSAFIVAQRASQLTGIPYVLDFRDSWTLTEEFEGRQPAWAKRRDRRTLYGLLKKAQAVIFRFRTEAECYWRAYREGLDVSRIHIIPNGYEGMINQFQSSLPRNGDKCTVLYTGTVTAYKYDTFLQALGLLKKSLTPTKQLRLLFVGEGTEILADKAAAIGISDIIETRPPVSQAEVTRLQKDANALLLLEVKPQRGYEFCGSKIFSYLKAGRPIVGVLSPAEEAAKILHEVGVSSVADVNAPTEIVALLRMLLDGWSAGDLRSLVPNPIACKTYSAQQQTAALVRALEGTPTAEPFVPGSVDIAPSLRAEISDGGWVSDCHRI
jgi:glycosyltransferase involved in cell wall biosynthesis